MIGSCFYFIKFAPMREIGENSAGATCGNKSVSNGGNYDKRTGKTEPYFNRSDRTYG